MPELKKILIVDDSADIRLILNVVLKKIGGYEIQACESGPDALQKAPEFEPDLVILDIMMPEMSGPEVCAALGADPILAQVPVIYLSAANQELNKCREQNYCNVIGTLEKPFDPIQFSAKLRAIWQSYHAEA